MVRPMLALLLVLLAPRDLDVGVPAGPPTSWTQRFPVLTPRREVSLPLTPRGNAPGPSGRGGGTVVQRKTVDLDFRASSSFEIVRILTLDLPGHIAWVNTRAPDRGPITGSGSAGKALPRTGEALRWIGLAALLRLLLHPQLVAEKEVEAHLVELGEPMLPMLDAAAAEPALARVCASVKAMLGTRTTAQLKPPAGAAPGSREGMLARFVAEELTSAHPYDPEDTFGRRLFLLAEEVEPYLQQYATHGDSFLRRNAVAALGRYRTNAAMDALADLVQSTGDPVVRMRALTALAGCGSFANHKPLLDWLARVQDPVERVALVEALGCAGVQEAAPALLAIARNAQSPDLMQAALTALARLRREAGGALGFARAIAKAARDAPERWRVRPDHAGPQPDNVDSPEARGEIIEQLALLLVARLDPADADTKRRLLALGDPKPDPRPPPVRRRVRTSALLQGVPPPVQFLYLETLRDLGEAGIARLEAIAADDSVEAALRGYALAQLPYDRRGDLAAAYLGAERESLDLKVYALDVLAADGHAALAPLARRLLEACAKGPAGGGAPEQRQLWLSALRALEYRGLLTEADVLPLLRHPRARKSEREMANGEVLEAVGRAVESLVDDAAEGRGRHKALLEALLDLVIEGALNRRINEITRGEARTYVTGLLAGLPARKGDRRYRDSVVTAVTDYLIGPEARALRSIMEFRPIVLLEEEILLALGRLRTEQAGKALVAFLAEVEPSPYRAWAALALGLAGQERLASHLVLVLLDQDGFTRFCAYEALRRLTRQEFWADWIYGPEAERFKAAERYRAVPRQR